jgi:hypothetical protein
MAPPRTRTTDNALARRDHERRSFFATGAPPRTFAMDCGSLART